MSAILSEQAALMALIREVGISQQARAQLSETLTRKIGFKPPE